MRVDAICREAWRDVVSGTARTVVCAVALCVVVLGLATTEVAAARQAVRAALAFRAAGAATVTLAAPGRVDAATCAGLADLDGVAAAGAVRGAEHPFAPAALPRGSVPLVEVTPGLLEVVGAAVVSPAGVVLSDQAADALAARPGGTVATTGGVVQVAGTYAWPSDGRRPGYGYAVLAPTPATA